MGIQLKGKGANINAIGAKINVYIKDQILSKEVIPARGFQSSVDYKQIFGLGATTKIDSIKIIWPNATVSSTNISKIDTVYQFDQSTLIAAPLTIKLDKTKTLFTEVAAKFDRHEEDDHVDFYAERIIPRILSQEGPKAASADLNGDGLVDVFVGGANEKGGAIFIQNANGAFVKKPQAAFLPYNEMEDVAAVFYDADKDGDMDLLVGAGGNHKLKSSGLLNHRLFLNDGKANFTYQQNAFPEFGFNTSVMVPLDFDEDGDMDVFVGARNTPLKYGVTPSSAIYVNDGTGKYTDQTANIAPSFTNLGMVTSANWNSILGKQGNQLIVAGDYMYPIVFSFKGGKFVEEKTNLTNLFGWWQSIQVVDLNGDGLKDIVLGNMGKNGYLKPTPDAPVKLWMNDFDGNESLDKILTRTVNGKDVPVFLKAEMQEQIPLLKKENLNYEVYAKKSFQELFKPEAIEKAVVKTYNFCSSIIAWNKGGGQYEIQELPIEVQFSSLNAILPIDINGDQKMDLIMGGNLFGFMPQFGRLDANYGLVLMNEGAKRFKVLEDKASGLAITGQVKDILSLPGKSSKQILFIRNDDYPVLLKMNQQ